MTRPIYKHRNPWHGCESPWQEFKWAVRHPGDFFCASWAGLRGHDTGTTKELRVFGYAMLGLGSLQLVGGIVALLIGYGVIA